MMKKAIPLLLFLLFSGTAGWAQYKPLTVPDLPNLEVRRVERARQDSLRMGNLPAVERRAVAPPERSPLQISQFPEIQHRRVVAPEVSEFIGPQLPRVELLSMKEFKDFKGGLNLGSYKTKVAPNQAIVLENALWNEQGEMYKRPGFSEHSTPPFIPNFLYRYYKQDGKKFTMGGSDTALYFWQYGDTAWTYLIGTNGTPGRWDGATFEDYFIGTHFGVKPVVWDGDSIFTSLTLEASDSFFVEFSTIVKDTMYTDCGRFQSVFTLTSPPASFTVNQLVGYTFEWYENTGSAELQRMLVLSNTEDEIKTTLPCSLDLVPDMPERWCWVRPWFHSVDVDSGTSDSVTVCYDDPDFCCFRPGDEAPSVRLWDSDLDTLKLKRDWSQILAVTDSRGNVLRNYIGGNMAFGVRIDAGSPPDTNAYVTINGWMVACFSEASHYEIYEASSALDDEGIKFVETFDSRLWFAWTGVNAIDSIIVDAIGDSSYAGEDTSVGSIDTSISSIDSTCAEDSCEILWRWVYFADDGGCGRCSSLIVFDPDCGWDTHVFEDSVVLLPVEVYSDTSYSVHDTVLKWLLVDYIAPGSLYVKFHSNYGSEGYPVAGRYAHLFTQDSTGNLWREGTLDSASMVGVGGWSSLREARLWDEDYSWDSTATYEDYLFTVTGGTGAGIKTFLFRWNPLLAGVPNYRWSDSSFFVPNFSPDCFDNTTEYQIHSIDTASIMPCYVETTFSYDTTFTYTIVWEYFETYDTNYTDQQNKNKIIYSEIPELGGLTVWLPEHHIYLTPGDGDYITGMISLSDARYVDVPTHVLMVAKNSSSYKIVPTLTAGAYAFWYISTRVGCVSNSAMSVGEGLVLFPDQDGVWAWDQRDRPQCISLLIDPIFEDLALENLEDASAIYNPQDRHYYISLPTRVDTVYNGDFIVTFRRDSSFYEDQCVHLITTLDGEQGGDVVIVEDSSSNYCDIAADTLGNYCVLIRELYDLFLFRYDSLNAEVGARIKVTDEAGKVTMSPIHLDMNNNGRIIAVWEDWRDDELFGTPDVYGQCLDFTDGKVGSNFPVNVDYLTNQDGGGNGSTYPSVAINDDSVCVIVWQTWDDPGAPATCIYAAMDTFPVSFSSLSYFEPEENCGSSYSRWWPDVDAGDTTFVVVYMNDDWLKGYVVHATYNYDLDVINSGTIGQPDDVTGSAYPSVAMNKEGRFVVSWWHVVGLNSNTIWARKYDVGGVASGSYFRVDNTTDVMFTVYPDVAINELDQYCIVWGDARITGTGATTHNYYKCYTWDGGAVSSDSFLNDMVSATYGQPEITLGPTWVEYDTTKHTFAWSIDYHGWSEESFDASTYCYQHGLTDPVKVLFADPEETKVYNYGTQADDVNDAVILTYQSPYLSFTEYPYWENFLRYVTVEAYLGTGTIYLDFYVDYSTLVYQDSILCGTDCREEIQLPNSLHGKNLSMKVRSGSTIDEFYLSRYWWEYNLKKERD